jgi:hypothetical protein
MKRLDASLKNEHRQKENLSSANHRLLKAKLLAQPARNGKKLAIILSQIILIDCWPVLI